MKTFSFTIDDNIRFLEEINKNECSRIFDNPYAAMLKRLHERFGIKVQLNLFYQNDSFDLSMMTDRYRAEWEENCDWLKLSFHSRLENVKPYEFSGYDEVFEDCRRVNEQIKRFAGEKSLADTTTVHYCLATKQGLDALYDNGIRGLLGLFGEEYDPTVSYCIEDAPAEMIKNGHVYNDGRISYAGIDVVMNCFSISQNLDRLKALVGRDYIKIMIHEQFFYPDYPYYQADFEQKLAETFSFLNKNGYDSVFFEDMI